MNDEPLRVLVIDDEAPARKRLCDILHDCAAQVPLQIVAEASDGTDALEWLNRDEADVAFVDVRMPSMDGIEFARHAQKLARPPAIVFTTAFDAYAVKAFEVNAMDYLLKPIRRERLALALQKVRKRTQDAVGHLPDVSRRARRHLSVVERGRVVLVAIPEILYLRAEAKYVTIRTAERELLLEESLSSLETEFAEEFVRIHRSCLVRREAIAGFERVNDPESDSRWVAIVAQTGERLPVSRRQQHIVREF